ncbi:hypothetical protein ABG067_002297 [Albugo candida]
MPETSIEKLDPRILKQLRAQITSIHGSRKNLAYVITLQSKNLAKVYRDMSPLNGHESSQSVTRSFEEFRDLRKSLLSRLTATTKSPLAQSLLRGQLGLKKSFSAANVLDAAKQLSTCNCKGSSGCTFDVMCVFLERLRFSRNRFFRTNLSEADISCQRSEAENFITILLTIIQRVDENELSAGCLFLQDILKFLDLGNTLSAILKQRSWQMNLHGWRNYNTETFGNGIRADQKH